MANLKEAMKAAKATGKPQRVTEPTPITETKVNISVRLDLEILNWLKAEAKAKGLPYQTHLNSILIQAKNTPNLEERLKKIEKAVFKGKAG